MSFQIQLYTQPSISLDNSIFTGYQKSTLFLDIKLLKKEVDGQFRCIFLNLDIKRSLSLGDFFINTFFLSYSLTISTPVGQKNTYTFLKRLGILAAIISYRVFKQPYTTGNGAFRYSSWSGIRFTTGQGQSKGFISTLVKRQIAWVRIVAFEHTNTIFYYRAIKVKRSRKMSRVKRESMQYAHSSARLQVRAYLLSCRQALLLPQTEKSSNLSVIMFLVADSFLSSQSALLIR